MISIQKRICLLGVLFFFVSASPGFPADDLKKGKIPTETPTEPGVEHIHIVKPGESLSSIVRSYFGDNEQLKAIARFNRIDNIHQIRVGQEIKIPVVRSANIDSLQENDLSAVKSPAGGGDADRINETVLKKEKPASGTDAYRRMNRIVFVLIVSLLLAALVYLLKKFAALQDTPVKTARRENKYFTKIVEDAESPETKPDVSFDLTDLDGTSRPPR